MFDMVDLVETHRKLAGADAGLLSDGELLAGAVVLKQVVSLVEVALAHRLAELDARGRLRVSGV